MKFGQKFSLSLCVAVLSGITVLLGYFFDSQVLDMLSTIFLRYAIILAAVALLIGLFYLARKHWDKITHRNKGWFYSLITLITMLITMVIGLVYRPTSNQALWIFNSIQVPIESSLAAILAIILVYTAARILYRRLSVSSVVFLIVLLITLLGTFSLKEVEIPGLAITRSWILQVWSLGGLRGLLLGVALGTIATGVRVFMGAERPYER